MELTPEIQARLKLWSDFETYAKYCLKVQTEEGGNLSNFELNEIQLLLQKILKHIRENNRLIRCVILKARREGVSTWVTGRFYWKTSMNKNRYSMIIAHEPEAKDFLFNMVKRYHIHCPTEFKPEDKYNNKAILEFNNQSGTGLDSAIRVACAGKEDLGSGMKIDFLHISELSKWDRNIIKPLLTSVFQTVPSDPSTEIFIESTAKGVGGEFYDRYWNSRYRYSIYLDENYDPQFKCEINEEADEYNEYSSIFIPCFVFKKYRRPITDNFTPTQEEEDLIKQYNVPKEFLEWRRWCIANKCDGRVEIFKQEYPMNAIEAFQSDAISVFNTETVLELKRNCIEPKVKYEIQTSLMNVVSDKNGRFSVWEEPLVGKKYIVSVDVSEGLEGDKKDFTCIQIIDWLTGTQVAEWHGKLSPDLVGIITYIIALRYNKAYVAPERNNHGLVVINKLLDLGYTNIHIETQHEPPHKPRKRYGWVTSKSTKPAIIDNLISEVRDGVSGIKNSKLCDEMLTFKQFEDGTFGAEEGHHDDRLMAFAIAKYIRTLIPLPKRISEPIQEKRNKMQLGDMKINCWF